jgi:hypothetical protein
MLFWGDQDIKQNGLQAFGGGGLSPLTAYTPPAAPTASGAAQFIDPETGKLLKMPTTAAEIAQAKFELENRDQGQWNTMFSQTQAPGPDVEAAINKGTEEINASQGAAQRTLEARNAAAGQSVNSSVATGGLGDLMSDYAGKRANLARDVRLADVGNRRAMAASLWGARPRLDLNFSGQSSARAGGGGDDSVHTLGAPNGGAPPAGTLRNNGMELDPLTRQQTGRRTNLNGTVDRNSFW